MRITQPTYYDESIDTAYPFDASSSRSNGAILIPDNVFVDGRLYPPNGRYDTFISSIEVGDQVIVTLSDGSGLVATGEFTRSSPPSHIDFYTATNIYAGALYASPNADEGLAILAGWDNGIYEFRLPHTRFAPTVITPQPQKCVRRIKLESGEVFFGDVTLVGENGVQLTVVNQDGYSSSSSHNGDYITWDKYSTIIRADVVGDPLAKRKECDAQNDIPDSANVLKKIRFESTEIPPHGRGSVNIFVGLATGYADDPALRIENVTNGLRLNFLSGDSG